MLGLDDIVIDPEFRDLLPAVDDVSRLRAKIELEGWSEEPVTVWQHHNILLDGHNRVGIWKERGDDGPPVRELKFANREAAFHWVVNNQIARRNLTPEQQKYVLGLKYKAEKGVHGAPEGNRRAQKQKDQNDLSVSTPRTSNPTAERIGRENGGVSQAVVRRAENYADAVDDLDKRGVLPKADLLTGKVKVPALRVIEASKAPTAQEAKAVIDGADRKKKAEAAAEKEPFRLETDRQRSVARKNYERLGILFGQTQAIADGIEAINLEAALSVLKKSDAESWIDDAKRTIAALKTLSTRLKTEADRGGLTADAQEAEDGVDHGGETDG